MQQYYKVERHSYYLEICRLSMGVINYSINITKAIRLCCVVAQTEKCKQRQETNKKKKKKKKKKNTQNK
jgi:hypothetical protein